MLGVMTVVGGSGLFLTIWRSLGDPPGEQDVLKKHVFDQNLEKCLKPIILTHFLFHRIVYFGTTGSVELDMSKNAMFNSMERPIFPLKKKRTFVHKFDEGGDIRS